MIEFLQSMVDIASRAVPEFVTKKNKDAATKLGSELFIFYIQVNEALMLGDRIIQSLEVYIQRMEHHMQTGNDKYALEWGRLTLPEVHEQLQNIFAIRSTMSRWRNELQILHGSAYSDLRPLLEGKASALSALANIVESDKLPLLSADLFSIDHLGVVDAADARFADGMDIHRWAILNDEFMNSSVPLNAPWESNIFHSVKNYLESNRPKERLEMIRKSLEEIRQALESNFTLSDVLLAVGDSRFRRQRRS